MPRQPSSMPTDRESEIMAVLWELGTATADEVRRRLKGQPHDSTVRTLLRVLVEKGQVIIDKEVRPASYRPRVRQRSVRKRAARDLVRRFFGGSAEELVLHLLENERLSAEQLRRLEKEFQERCPKKES